ncbi:GNAT family N-acetyltransferase [Acinetobacter puyangensis]|uniref:Ribosomal protein S18 acetylase RimI n=1 Tax=Acinetobacter puyangensis TaxID=1096779 RepID=A0A240ECI2_9GAMM|nr:GNAT family N-acetyltransferase [Acinetobacter puyangensis]SNX45615.1 Ribosomal protein S18 acetylase RimI [Acinetobacter puyangensis]
MAMIRRAEAADIDAISAMIQPYIDDFAVDETGRAHFTQQNILNVLQMPDIEYFVYVETTHVVGVIAYQLPSHLVHFFVDQSHQHQGIGKKMWQFVEDKLRDEGMLEVTVNSSCYAGKIYQTFGFLPTQTVIEDRGIRFIPMKKTYLSTKTQN